MGKTIWATPLWIWGGCSEGQFLSVRSATTLDEVFKRLYGKRCGILKYFRLHLHNYKHMETANRKIGESVQETLLLKEAILIDN